jgi:hypothetical protein
MVHVKPPYLIDNHTKKNDRGPDVPKTTFSSVEGKKDCEKVRGGIQGF